MKRLFLPALLFIASLGLAQNPFSGTWKLTPDKVQLPTKPVDLQLKNGRYICSSCVPKIDVKADGSPQPVTGSPYYDALSVSAPDENSVELHSTKGGKTVGETTFKVGADGKTLTSTYKDYSAASGEPQSGTNLFDRVGNPPSSGNKVSGKWRAAKVEQASPDQLMFTFTGEGNELTYKAKTGEGYTAKLDGKDYPYNGDPGITSVSLRQINDRTIEETDKRDGRPIYIQRLTVSPDGKTMTASIDDKLRNQSMKWTAEKQ